MDDFPLFSLRINQIMSSNTNRVYDREDLDWAENRSKKLHYSFVMANVSTEKVKNNVPSFSKAKIEKKPLKRGQKSIILNFLIYFCVFFCCSIFESIKELNCYEHYRLINVFIL